MGKKLTDASIPTATAMTDDDLLYALDAPGGTATSKKITWANIKATLKTYFDTLYLAIVTPGTSGNVLTSNGSAWVSSAPGGGGGNEICDGRLTLTSGMPVTTADVTGATNVYFTPYKGNKIALYDGASAWTVLVFTELTLALGTVTSGLPYDIFAYNNSGTVALEKLAWTNGTTRATALTLQDGVLVKTGATTRRYIGTIYTTSTTATEDSMARRLVFNYYNRVRRKLKAYDSTTSWTYNTAAWRAANNNTTDGVDRVAVMIGWSEDAINIQNYHFGSYSVSAAWLGCGIGIDSTTVTSALPQLAFGVAAGTGGVAYSFYDQPLAVGYHYIQRLEYGGGATTTFYGDVGAPAAGINQFGMIGSVMA